MEMQNKQLTIRDKSMENKLNVQNQSSLNR